MSVTPTTPTITQLIAQTVYTISTPSTPIPERALQLIVQAYAKENIYKMSDESDPVLDKAIDIVEAASTMEVSIDPLDKAIDIVEAASTMEVSIDPLDRAIDIVEAASTMEVSIDPLDRAIDIVEAASTMEVSIDPLDRAIDIVEAASTMEVSIDPLDKAIDIVEAASTMEVSIDPLDKAIDIVEASVQLDVFSKHYSKYKCMMYPDHMIIIMKAPHFGLEKTVLPFKKFKLEYDISKDVKSLRDPLLYIPAEYIVLDSIQKKIEDIKSTKADIKTIIDTEKHNMDDNIASKITMWNYLFGSKTKKIEDIAKNNTNNIKADFKYPPLNDFITFLDELKQGKNIEEAKSKIIDYANTTLREYIIEYSNNLATY